MAQSQLPPAKWQHAEAADVGIDADRLKPVKAWLDQRVEGRKYRFVLVRSGKLVVEWNRGIDSDEKIGVASTWKSMLSNVLGQVVAAGKLPSADAEVYPYWPDFFDVPAGTGPKEGRYAFDKDRHLTFRQLISNTSGYMKPGEAPGTVFHYQSWGMNILSHALAHLYGYYDTSQPEASDGFMRLLQEQLAAPLGVDWRYSSDRMELPAAARQNIFGYGTRIHTTALDLARAGWLWCNYGRWHSGQLVPEAWMRDSTQVAPHIKAHCPPADWLYGNGFWSNSEGKLWPELPCDGFHSWGAGGHYAAVFPSEELVVVQNPDPFGVRGGAGANPDLIKLVFAACS